MGNYTLDQAQADVANLRGQIAHLQAFAELLQVQIDTSLTLGSGATLTLPDASTWKSAGLSSLKMPGATSDNAAIAASSTLGYVENTPSVDGVTYWMGKRVCILTSTQALTGTLANISWIPGGGGTIPVEAISYHIYGHLLMSASTASLAIQASTTATASFTMMHYLGTNTNTTAGAQSYIPTYVQSTNTLTSLGSGFTPAAKVWFDGVIKFTSSGNFNMQMKVTAGSSTLSQGCFMVMDPVPDV